MLITLQPVGFCQYLETWGLNCVMKTEFCIQNIPSGPRKRYKDSCGLSSAYATNFLSLAPD